MASRLVNAVKEKLLPAVFYLLVFAIPFGTRKLIFQFTEGFDEYNTVFIYGTDIILAILLILFFVIPYLRLPLRLKGEENHSRFLPLSKVGGLRWGIWALLFFILSAGISIFFAHDKGLAVYQFMRLGFLVGLAFATAGLLRRDIVNLRGVFAVLGLSAVFQSLVAFSQFARQGSVGLGILGESFLNTDTAGVAKLAIDGGRFIRAYGMMPHPNVLGGFLVVGLLSLSYLWLWGVIANNANLPQQNNANKFLVVVGIFIVTLGLVLTFSRAAWLVGTLAVFASALSARRKSQSAKWRIAELLFIFSFSAALVIFPLRALVFPRAEISVGEASVTARLSYNDLALQIIKTNPLGVGIGNQVIYSVKTGLYQKMGMKKVWQWQPVHNIYLLIASELGWAGLLGFIAMIVHLLIGSNVEYRISQQYSKFNIQISLIMLGALLLLGLFDHYLWTIQQGRLLLWLTIGITLGLTNGNILYYNHKHENRN